VALQGPVYTLLLVDDEPLLLSALRRTLTAERYRILTAATGAEALGLLEREPVDLVLSDIDMPGMSGVALVAEIKRRYPEIVRILLTGKGSMESALQAINDGEVYRYLAKPFEPEELRSTIREAISRLGELRRAAAADRAATRRQLLMSELGREHPGILAYSLKDGAYAIDREHIERLVAQLDDPTLKALLGR
jgi:DNA-binding NtrC family response regulator